MFSARLQGLNTLYGLTLVLLVPLWFLLTAVFAVSVWGIMDYRQINYMIYLPALAMAFFLAGGYRRPRTLQGPARVHWMAAVTHANRDMLFNTLMILGLIYATKDKAISRQFVAAYLASSWLVLILLHRYLPSLLAKRLFSEERRMKTIFVGAPSQAAKLTDWAREQQRVGMDVLGWVAYEGNPAHATDSSLPLLGKVSRLEEILQRRHVQQVILLETQQSENPVAFVVECCQRAGARILIFNPWEELFHKPMQAINDGEHTFFALSDEPLQNPVNRLIKRILDLLVAVPVVVLVLPVLSLVIKLVQSFQAPGPLLYRQERTGAEKRKFTIYKFRTMHVRKGLDDEVQALPGDNRIYPFGAFLRRTSLDEFPQFFNVLIGSMSVVGPRPHLVQHDEEFARLVEIYRSRHYAKPGITGMAQYKGYRGAVLRPEDIEQRLELDIQYIYQWSFWLDIGIIIKTFAAVFHPPRTAC